MTSTTITLIVAVAAGMLLVTVAVASLLQHRSHRERSGADDRRAEADRRKAAAERLEAAVADRYAAGHELRQRQEEHIHEVDSMDPRQR